MVRMLGMGGMIRVLARLGDGRGIDVVVALCVARIYILRRDAAGLLIFGWNISFKTGGKQIAYRRPGGR